MPRSLKLLIALGTIASAPLPALAQSWPTAVVASAPRLTVSPRVPALSPQRGEKALRAATIRPAQTARPALKLSASVDPDDVPEVEVRAKAEWSDDQGLRVGPTRLAYKSRF